MPGTRLESAAVAPIFPRCPPPMALRDSLRLSAAAALVGVAALASPVSAAPASMEPVGPVVELVHESDVPQPFRLSAPSPNPFRTETRLTLSVDAATTMSVAVHDALGRRVALIHDGDVRPGTYTLRVDAGQLPPGLYLVRATDGQGRSATRAVSLVR